jgi:hypothetical protein
MSKGSEVLTRAITSALNEVAPGLEVVLEAHLRATLNRGLEVAYDDPKAFKDAVSKLFGEYSARLLEMVIISKLRNKFEWVGEASTLEELVERIKETYGG